MQILLSVHKQSQRGKKGMEGKHLPSLVKSFVPGESYIPDDQHTPPLCHLGITPGY